MDYIAQDIIGVRYKVIRNKFACRYYNNNLINEN